MKKMYVLTLALTAMTMGFVQANEVVAQEPLALSHEEQAFAEQLSETHRVLFSAMTAEQKKAAMAAATEADAAIEAVIQELPAESVR
ncbi:MAG: hypothetical protein LVR00_09495 [Rhabdochlamydiaceae bacterium]|jgi:hypothetical protein